MKAANQKEALNLNNKSYFITPYTLGLVLQSPNTCGGYRIGDILISINEKNPSNIFGGKWELLCPGRTLVCIDKSQTEFNTIRKIGGETKHTLTVDEMPKHEHKGLSWYGNNEEPLTLNSGSAGGYNLTYHGGTRGGQETGIWTNETGGGQSHNNLQPYMTVYMWVRVS